MSDKVREAAAAAAFVFEAILELREVGTYRNVLNMLNEALAEQPPEAEHVARGIGSGGER